MSDYPGKSDWKSICRSRLSRRFGVLAVGFLATFFANCLSYGTEPKSDNRSVEPSAKSILEDPTSPNGRIGGYSYRGSLTPTPGVNSRFANGARYGSAGNVVGVDRNFSGSRFSSGGGNAFRSKIDYSALSLRNEMRRAQNTAKASETFGGDNVPRLVTATPPGQVPYRRPGAPRYGLSREEALLQQQFLRELAQKQNDEAQALTEVDTVSTPQSPRGASQQLWMRDRPSYSVSPLQNEINPYVDEPLAQPLVDDFFDFKRYRDENNMWGTTGYLGAVNGLGGSLNLETSPTQTFASTPLSLPYLNDQNGAAFQEYLETQLLSSPDVNPLSPIQVDYFDGVVTIRGVVPTPAARLAAGNIMLSDPRVNRVNNLLTYMRDDSQDRVVAPNDRGQANSDAKKESDSNASKSEEANARP